MNYKNRFITPKIAAVLLGLSFLSAAFAVEQNQCWKRCKSKGVSDTDCLYICDYQK